MVSGFLDRLFGRRQAGVRFPPVAVPGPVYAIGDVHGMSDLLERLLDRIEAECDGAHERAHLVFLGDAIDRGEGSRRAVELMRGAAARAWLDPVHLCGDHEAMLLGFLAGEDPDFAWLRMGGVATLASYGVRISGPLSAPGVAGRLRADLLDALGEDLGFLRKLETSWRHGNVLFCHAGADPRRPADRQPEDVLVWGMEEPDPRPRTDGVWVVQGHETVPEAVTSAGRILLDTGACHSRVLSAVRLDPGGGIRFLVVRDEEGGA